MNAANQLAPSTDGLLDATLPPSSSSAPTPRVVPPSVSSSPALPAQWSPLVFPPPAIMQKHPTPVATIRLHETLRHRKRAVIVLHEIWGVTDSFKSQVEEWFSEEFTIVLLDLYRSPCATSIDEAMHLMAGLDFTQALRDIRATVYQLREKEGCNRIGLVGFGLGGCIALAASVHLKDIDGQQR